MKRNILISLLAIMAAACQSTSSVKEAPFKNDRIDLVLAKAANHIQESNRIRRENSNAITRKVLTDKQYKELALEAIYTPEGLEKPVSITWHGDIQGLIETIADLTGYKFLQTTPKVKTPVLVNVKSNDHTTALELLRTAGNQAGSRALIEVIPKGFVKDSPEIGVIKLTRN